MGAAPPPEEAEPAAEVERSEDDADERRRRTGRDALVVLAEEALARGELDVAEKRFARVLAVRPDSVRANLGAGRVARARGDTAAARAHFERAIAADPESAGALVELADLEAAAGRSSEARVLLGRAVRVDFGQPAAHGRLIELTGRAPRGAPVDLDAALARAHAHPYDPRALTDAGAALAAEGRGAEAAPFFEKALWLADLDPAAAREAAERLPAVDPAWAERRVVPVRVFADETVRAEPHWDFRVRLLWLSASSSLDPVLATRFVVVELNAIRAGTGTLRLDGWFEGFRARTHTAPPGIVAAFTERPPPPVGTYRRGLAEFLGRHLAVRLEPGETASRVLAHEVLHLYGGIHLSPELDSLMNPTGESRRLDAANQAIARALRRRSFRGVGLEADVLAHADRDEVIAAYEQALAVNLLARNAGIDQALQSRDRSRVLAAREVRRATELDPHLADVSFVLARILLADGRRGEALLLFDSAARLAGNTEKGRRARAEASALQRSLEADYAE